VERIALAQEIGVEDVAFWRPASELAPYVSGYHLYRMRSRDAGPTRDVFFPSWSLLRFAVDADQWSLKLGRHHFSPMPPASFMGPSSHAAYCEARSGLVVGAGVLPAGWSRFFGRDASAHANRIVPLAAMIDDAPEFESEVRGAVLGEGSPKTAFDRWFLDRLARTGPEHPLVARVHALINDPTINRTQPIADATGLAGRALVTFSRTHFGFAPKLLLRRARFLRALSAAVEVERGRWRAVAQQAGYFDGSHFLRDCHLFLDRPLGAFIDARRGSSPPSGHQRPPATSSPKPALQRAAPA
jgi:hypothetical protein